MLQGYVGVLLEKMFPPKKMNTADVVPVSLVSIQSFKRYIYIWLYVQFLLPW